MKYILTICLLFTAGCGEFTGDPGMAYWQVQQMNQQRPQYYNPPMFYQPLSPNNYWQETYYMQQALKKPPYPSTPSSWDF